jgi:hypothetical protein
MSRTERGFKEGDVILEVAGKSVTSAGEVRQAITAARNDNKNSVLNRVNSGGRGCAFGQGITIYESESVAGISRPADRAFQGASPLLAPVGTFRWNTPPSVGRPRAVRSPSFTARFFCCLSAYCPSSEKASSTLPGAVP